MKRIFQIVTLCLLVSLFTLSCKKEHIATQNNASPVFSFTGLVGGTAMNFRAGLNNYYMYSSYSQDSASGVYSYTGNLKEYNCNSSCPPSIQFIINNYHTLPFGASETNIGKSLATGYLGYLVPGGNSITSYTVFRPIRGNNFDTIQSYTWNFGDGTVTTIKSPNLDTIVHTYNHTGNYATSLSVLFNGNVTTNLSTPIQMGNANVSITCQISVSANTFNANTIGGSGTYTYHWDFGDSGTIASDTANVQNPTHNYLDSSHYHTVTLTVYDNVNHLKAQAKALAASSNASAQNYLVTYYTDAPKLLPNPNGLSNVTVNYTDATGDQYTSNNPAQPDSSYFQITSVTNYQNNENNQSTKQLHVTFDCILFDYTGKTLAIKNGDAIIAVAYK